MNPIENISEVVSDADPEIEEVVTALNQVSVDKAITGILTLVIGIVCITIVIKLVRKLISRIPNADKTVSGFLISAFRVILIFILLIIFFGAMGIPVTSLVAVLSMFALAVSLSVQNMLSNVVSGIVILMTKPFKAGDWIETPSTSGTVERIDLMYTHLLAVDLKRIMVPNSELSAARITNYSSVPYRKIVLNVRVGYEADNRTVIAALLRAGTKAISGKDTGKEEPPFAATNDYKDSGIEYLLRIPVKTSDYWDVYYDLLLRVRDELAADGIAMDYAATRMVGMSQTVSQ